MAKAVKAVEQNNLYAALAYLLGLITGVLMLIVEPKDKFVKFHAMQSIIFSIVIIVIQILLGIIFMPLTILTLGMAAIIYALIGMLIGLVVFVLWLLLMYKAYNGEKYMLPAIGKYADDLASKN